MMICWCYCCFLFFSLPLLLSYTLPCALTYCTLLPVSIPILTAFFFLLSHYSLSSSLCLFACCLSQLPQIVPMPGNHSHVSYFNFNLLQQVVCSAQSHPACWLYMCSIQHSYQQGVWIIHVKLPDKIRRSCQKAEITFKGKTPLIEERMFFILKAQSSLKDEARATTPRSIRLNFTQNFITQLLKFIPDSF